MSNSNNFAVAGIEKGAHEVERIRQETGEAQDTASSCAISYVDQAKGTASDAVASVQETASDAATQARRATDDFQSQASAQTNLAADEGEKDVEAFKTTAAGYVDRAKELTWNAVSTAQGYVSGPKSNSGTDPNAPQSGVVSSLQSAPNSTLETSKTYLTSAQEAIQPHLQSVQETVQPYLESAQATVQPHFESAAATAKAYAAQAQSNLATSLGSENDDERNSKS